jgi:hypothetical protein
MMLSPVTLHYYSHKLSNLSYNLCKSGERINFASCNGVGKTTLTHEELMRMNGKYADQNLLYVSAGKVMENKILGIPVERFDGKVKSYETDDVAFYAV